MFRLEKTHNDMQDELLREFGTLTDDEKRILLDDLHRMTAHAKAIRLLLDRDQQNGGESYE